MHMKKSYCLGTIAQMAVTAFIMICIAMNKLANIMGDAIPEVLPYLICNFNLAIMISLYPITYGIVELLFVDAEK